MTVIEYAKSKTILEHAFNQNLTIPKSLWVKSNTFLSPLGKRKSAVVGFSFPLTMFVPPLMMFVPRS